MVQRAYSYLYQEDGANRLGVMYGKDSPSRLAVKWSAQIKELQQRGPTEFPHALGSPKTR